MLMIILGQKKNSEAAGMGPQRARPFCGGLQESSSVAQPQNGPRSLVF